jgi:hypothetical protein
MPPTITELIEKIKSTNNGYLFAPSESEIKVAKENPSVFVYTHFQKTAIFPHRISLK